MYIDSIKIKDFRVLENITINFSSPENKKNVINVIAGINGSGKTSILEALKLKFIQKNLINSISIDFYYKADHLIAAQSSDPSDTLHQITTDAKIQPPIPFDPPLQHYGSTPYSLAEALAKTNKESKGEHSSPRIIYSPAKLAFEYQQVATLNTSYRYYNEIDTKNLLGNAEFYIRDFVISKERESNNSDPKERTKQAVESFNEHFKYVDMATTLHTLDIHKQNRPVFKNSKGDLVSIEQLSDGEKQLYGRVVSLMILNPTNSIIMIDEPEISLHPSWQLAIMKIYTQIGSNNQFIIATHSPQIIANTPYENLIILNRNKQTGKIEVVKPMEPPSGADVNSILEEVMGSDSMPTDQEELYKRYRQFIEKKQEDSHNAIQIREKILERENENSEFLQEMKFMIELREI